MTPDESLRAECEAFLKDQCNEFELCANGKPYQFQLVALMNFAKRQQVVGLKIAGEDLRERLEAEEGNTDDDAWTHLVWLESKAKELEA